MNQKKEEKKKNIDHTKREKLELKKFLFLSSIKQEEKIKEILNDMYENNVEIEQVHIDKVLGVAFSQKDEEIYLPKRLKVEKKDDELIFSFRKMPLLPLICFILAIILFGFTAGTFFGSRVAKQRYINIDIDKDGIPDINIDTDDDLVADINIDTNRDNKPDLNINYKGNRIATFNIYKDGTIINPINQDIDKDGVCDVNCDTDGDGWPDLNLDIDADGRADLDIDTDNDGIKDLNLDTNRDMVCDINCDTDGDSICDTSCVVLKQIQNGGGSSAEIGDGEIDITTVSLLVNYLNKNGVYAKEIIPDDMKNSEIEPLMFEVINQSNTDLAYSLSWVVSENNFISDNFQYSITSTSNGFKKDWTTVPKKEEGKEMSTSMITEEINIPANTKQVYTINFKLHGTHDNQNYDSNRTFSAKIAVTYLGKVG